MKTRKRVCLAVILVLLSFCWVLPPVSQAAKEFEKVGVVGALFQNASVDARIRSLACAGVALQPGASAAFWNPGALAMLKLDVAAQFTRTDLLGELRLESVSGSVQVHGIGFGVLLAQLEFEGRIRTVYKPDGDGRTYKTSDKMGILAAAIDAAHWLRNPCPWVPDDLSWGIGLGIRAVQAELAGDEGSEEDLDLGTLLSYHPGAASLAGGSAARGVSGWGWNQAIKSCPGLGAEST